MTIEILKAEADRMYDWIDNRGGIAVWQSLDLRNPDAKVFTPARTTTGEPTTRPGWQYAQQPSEIITDRNDISTYEEILFEAFPVGLKQKGMALVRSDAAQRKLDKTMERCKKQHGNSHYRKGVLTNKNASIGVYYAV